MSETIRYIIAAILLICGVAAAAVSILGVFRFRFVMNRMRDYPVRIELLSRFRTPKEIQRAIEDTRRGAVDILIGTHRLLCFSFLCTLII